MISSGHVYDSIRLQAAISKGNLKPRSSFQSSSSVATEQNILM